MPDTSSDTAAPASRAGDERPAGPPAANGAPGEEKRAAPGGATSRLRMLWPVLLSLLALGAVAAFTFEPGTFWDFANQVNPWLAAGACLLAALRVFFGGWRFQYVSRGRLSLAEGTRGQVSWDFLSNITPTAIGGGPFAIVFIAQDQDLPAGEVSAFMLFSMVLDQIWFTLSIPLIIWASAYFNVFPDALGGVGHWTFIAYFAGLIGWAVLFTYATLFRPDLLRRMAGWVFSFGPLRRFRHRVVREATRFGERARGLRSESLAFYLKSFLLTIGIWLGRYLLIVAVIWSVFPKLDLWLATLRSAALTLSGLAMPTPGGAGGLEGFYALFFGPLMPSALMAPTLLVWRFLGYYVFVLLGVYLSLHRAREELQR